MKKISNSVACIILLLALSHYSFGQPPCQNGPDGLIYIQGGTGIQNYDPSLPISATNPVTNTIPNGGGGLAVANNLNGPGPSPTFYAVVGGNWIYWDGTAWVNTGHSAGGTAAVNPGGGGNYIYNLIGASGQVYQYDGTGNSTLLLTVPGFQGGGPYDLVGDCDGGFYILKTNATSTPGPFLRKYNSSGVLVQSWNATGTSNSAGGGFAIVGNTVYYHNTGGFRSAPLTSGPTLNFTPNAATIPNPSDMACCPVCVATDTFYYCNNAPPINLMTTNIGTITWSVLSGTANITPNGQMATAVPTSPYATIIASSNQNALVDTYVLVLPDPNVSAGADDTIVGCDPFTTTLAGSMTPVAGINYTISWAPGGNITAGGTTLTPTVSQSVSTDYIVTVSTDATQGGCQYYDTVTMAVDNYTPLANFNFERRLGCINDTVIFTNTSVTNPNGSPTYFWTFGDGNFSSVQSPTHVYGFQNNYAVRLEVTDNGCVDDNIINVDIRHPLEADFAVTNTGPASDDSVCLGGSFIFSPTTTPIAGTANMTYDWDFGDGTVRLNAGAAQQVYQYPNPGTYLVTFTLTDTLGCVDTAQHTVYVDIPAYIELSAQPTDICVGQTVFFKDSSSPNTINLVYDFDDGNILNGLHNPAHVYEQAGVYNVNLLGQYLVCPNADTTITITVSDYPLVNLGEDVDLCPGVDTAVIISDINNPSQIMTWSTGAVASSISVGLNETGRYWATATNNACATTDSIWVKRDCYLNIPNSFSPNNDGRNDYFIPRQLLSAGVVAFDMKIMNRWGEVIFSTNSINGRGWDGKYGGKDQPVGVYVYMIQAKWKNGFTNQFNGNMTLLR